jgi:23S rRNA pseudouridine2457 synthase
LERLKRPVHQYFIVYKPYQALCQFTSVPDKKCLKDFFDVRNDVYSVGRLDYESEGLLILSNDKNINYRLLHPAFSHKREYWVQVEGAIDDAALKKLENGLEIQVDGKNYKTKKCQAILFNQLPPVAERNPPIRFRKQIPTSWIKLILEEGKNRQVRKMCAAAGFPTLRLIRYRISGLNAEGLQPGDMLELDADKIYRLLFSSMPDGRSLSK